jgi:hypothetical protein
MKKIIYKYALNPTGGELNLPKGAELLDIQMQGGEAVAWFSHDPNEEGGEVRTYAVLFTGQEFDDFGMICRKTLQVNGLVYHVYMS